jgi:UDP-N-acetylmuramoyl-tripeptide--D-alanyl-D-alanine ligase
VNEPRPSRPPRSWLASEIARLVSGRLVGADLTVQGVSTDSREVQLGSVFVPLIDVRDGHDFVDGARSAGAMVWLSSRPTDTHGAIVVGDTAIALTEWGRAARDLLPNRVVGITGSSGKTSTKDMLTAIFECEGPVAASQKSFNNEIGVPLTLINAPERAVGAVIEMGARGKGHIATLCAVARPTVGVIVNIGTAHRELFGSAEGTADAKSEIYDAIAPTGASVVNRDDALFEMLHRRAGGRVVTFSRAAHTEATVVAEQVTLDDDIRASFLLRSEWGSLPIRLGARGMHQVENALAAASAALAADVSLDHVGAGLATTELSPMRMDLAVSPQGVRVLNDSYNANPSSMRAALEALVQIPAARRFAVLGTMAELGPGKLSFHLEIGALARELGLNLAVALHEQDFGLVNVTSVDDALAALGPLRDGDVVLVKGSRVAGLERVAARLLADGVAT